MPSPSYRRLIASIAAVAALAVPSVAHAAPGDVAQYQCAIEGATPIGQVTMICGDTDVYVITPNTTDNNADVTIASKTGTSHRVGTPNAEPGLAWSWITPDWNSICSVTWESQTTAGLGCVQM
jgi:hypothetical protein